MADSSSLFGSILVGLFSVWGVCFLIKSLGAMLARGNAIDRTLSEVNRKDNPRLFALEVIGYILLITSSGLIGIGALGVMCWQLVTLIVK